MRFLFVILCIWPTFVAAQSTSFVSNVRSGEHETFTRVVLDLPAGETWRVSQSGQIATLKLGTESIRFDVSRAFQRIDHHRLAAISFPKSSGELEFQLSCDCEMRAYEHPSNLLVLDIVERPEDSTTTVNGFMAPTGRVYRFSDLEPETMAGRDAPVPVWIDSQPAKEQISSPITLQKNDQNLHHLPINASNQRSTSEDRLIESIFRASDLGLIETSTQDRIEHHQSPAPDVTRNLIISSTAEANASIKAGIPESECPAHIDWDISNWAPARGFWNAIGDNRRKLYGEFDVPVAETKLTLARTFIYFGFGAEAKRIASIDGGDSRQTAQIFILAEIMDDTRQPSTDLNLLSDCALEAALWATLVAEKIPGKVDESQLELQFNRLPSHLRAHLGPRLATILSDAGLKDLAASIITTTSRRNVSDTGPLDLIHTSLKSTTNTPQQEQELLNIAAGKNTESSVQAILELIEFHTQSMTPLGKDARVLLSSYATQYGNTELGVELRAAETVGFALSGQFDEAFSGLNGIEERDGISARKSLEKTIWRALSIAADDVTLLRHTLAIETSKLITVTPPVGQALATRLLELGFPDRAIMVMNTTAESLKDSYESRLVMGKAAIETGLPHRALVELDGVSGAEVNQIRAKALAMNGDFEQAAKWFEGQDMEESQRLRWHGGVPQNPEIGERDSHYLRIAKTTNELTKPAPARPRPPLENADALLAEAELTRSLVSNLISTSQKGI